MGVSATAKRAAFQAEGYRRCIVRLTQWGAALSSHARTGLLLSTFCAWAQLWQDSRKQTRLSPRPKPASPPVQAAVSPSLDIQGNPFGTHAYALLEPAASAQTAPPEERRVKTLDIEEVDAARTLAFSPSLGDDYV